MFDSGEQSGQSYSHMHDTQYIHELGSGLWKSANAPFSNVRVPVFQCDQEEEGRSFSHGLFL